MNLAELVPAAPSNEVLPEATYEKFLEWVSSRGLTLYPAQDEAVMEIVQGNHVILATPTGSGKSMVAIGAHFHALSRGEVSYYTAPIMHSCLRNSLISARSLAPRTWAW